MNSYRTLLAPFNIVNIHGFCEQPLFFPLFNSVSINLEVLTKFSQKVIHLSVVPSISMEIFGERLREALLSHQEKQLL